MQNQGRSTMPMTHRSNQGLGALPNFPGGDIVLYTAPDGTVKLDVRLEKETVWLSQKQMALLFDRDSDTAVMRPEDLKE